MFHVKPSVLLLAASLLNTTAFAYEISEAIVSGDRRAEVLFVASPSPEVAPSWQVHGNVMEINFPGAELPKARNGKWEVNSPHALVQRIQLFSTNKHGVHGEILFNGKSDDLRNRLSFEKNPRGIALAVEYPTGDTKAIDLMKEEQLPVLTNAPSPRLAEPSFQPRQIALVGILLALAGICTFVLFRFLKTKGRWKGSRKYLIESLGYCPLGGKSGISLIKVGREFILVGVTANQVSLLSTLPRLAEQYEEETQFERESFRDAVGEELRRMRKEIAQ